MAKNSKPFITRLTPELVYEFLTFGFREALGLELGAPLLGTETRMFSYEKMFLYLELDNRGMPFLLILSPNYRPVMALIFKGISMYLEIPEHSKEDVLQIPIDLSGTDAYTILNRLTVAINPYIRRKYNIGFAEEDRT